MRPGCSSAARCVSSARRAANRTPSSRSSAPDAIERGDLSERVAGERDDLVGERPHGFPRDERRAQHRELRVARAGELLGGRVEHERTQRLAERGLGLLEQLPRGVVLPGRAHAGHLGSLTGEHHRNAHAKPPGL